MKQSRIHGSVHSAGDVASMIEAGLADERNGLTQCLDGGGKQEVTAELDEICRRQLCADRECPLVEEVNQT